MNLNLSEFNNDTLAKIWNMLNWFDWPEDLGEKPKNWDNIPIHSQNKEVTTRYDIVGPIMDEVKNIIGLKECLRWYHLNILERDNEQFENWWVNEHDIEFEI